MFKNGYKIILIKEGKFNLRQFNISPLDIAYSIIKFDGTIDDTLLEELTKIDEILDIKKLHV